MSRVYMLDYEAATHGKERLTFSAQGRGPDRDLSRSSKTATGAASHWSGLVYARHGRELTGWKSPVGGSPSCIAKYMKTTTSPRQGRHREVRSEGSRRRRCEARNTNGIAGSFPSDEVAPHTEIR